MRSFVRARFHTGYICVPSTFAARPVREIHGVGSANISPFVVLFITGNGDLNAFVMADSLLGPNLFEKVSGCVLCRLYYFRC